MEDLFKKFLYTGVGLVSLTAEKLQEAVDELVGQGKVSKEEGRKIVGDFVDQIESKRDEAEAKMKEWVESFTKNMNVPKLATKEDLADLVKRIEALEAHAGMSTREEVTATVKKVKKVAGEAQAEVEEAAEKVETTARKTTKKPATK
ncbi:MAG: hypothetical protein D6722_02430 [Bacteroidetes bacterium]|nr:MAG: hypothetical protein D6722_02430 [Bacteroidota bacterium]